MEESEKSLWVHIAVLYEQAKNSCIQGESVKRKLENRLNWFLGSMHFPFCHCTHFIDTCATQKILISLGFFPILPLLLFCSPLIFFS